MAEQQYDENLEVSYDKESDVLYISEGRPREAISDLMDNGVILRTDPDTKKVVGITILDFISHYSVSMAHSLPIKADFQLINA
jgi:uncharacterized protein YuzE